MANCIPCVHIKHATLIENCYPPLKEEGTSPRSSELSYLTFYASSKPAKLTKVGTYIQHKVERDIRKGRKSHNLVSLQILKALIQTCHRDLNIFSKYIVKILSMLLDTRNLEIIDKSCETFIVFCTYHDGSTLGVDLHFTTDYENLLQKFSAFCNYTNGDNAYKMRYIGHRAIQAAVTSSALQASDFKTQVDILFPPLIITLASSKRPSNALQSNDFTIDIRDSAVDKNDLDPKIIELLASHTIAALFSNVMGPSVRRSLVPLFDYLDKKEKWGHSELAVNIMKLALQSVQPQYRYLLVSDILSQLDNLKDDNNEKQATLVLILESMLTAKIPLAGISVLEVLNSLFTSIIKTAHSTTNEKQYTIQDGLVKSIGGLATQIYYDHQLNDMTSYLIPKLRTNTSLEHVDNMLLHDYRVIVMNCLDSIVQGTKQLRSSADQVLRITGRRISLDTWIPALDLLQDKNSKTRIEFSKCLYNFLQNVPVSVESNDGYPKHTLTDHQDISFMDKLVHTLHDWILISDFNVTDLKSLYALLCLLVRQFGVDATVIAVPLVFKIQQLVQEETITLKARQFAIESALIEWFIVVGKFYSIDSLVQYAQSLKSSRPSDSVQLSESIEELEQPESFSVHIDDAETKPNRVWIEKSTVVEYLSKEGNLRDESDTHGLDLEAKLFAEWGYDSICKLRNDQINRMKIIQDINKIKPRLSSPWEVERTPITVEDRKGSIRVAHLKEALAGQLSTTDEDDAETTNSSSQSNHYLSIMKPLPIKPNDMNALFNELNLSQHAPSTVSLVNPPY